MGLTPRRINAAMAAAALATILAAATAHAQSVLRLVPQADLKILDTVQTTNNITSNHGYMIYDTLFSLDSKLVPKPQMVESYTKSADGLTWTFKLRPGLKFHDGQPVTSKDVVASILRFSKRIPAGVTMMQFTKEIVATGPDTFEIRLNKPFGLVLETLAGPENPLFITRESDAQLDPEHGDDDGDRLRPLHVRARGMGSRQQGRLQEESRLQAEGRTAGRLRRRQGRQGRSRRVAGDSRCQHLGAGPHQGRSRHHRDSADRSAAAHSQGPEHHGQGDRPRRHAGDLPDESPDSAVQQSPRRGRRCCMRPAIRKTTWPR